MKELPIKEIKIPIIGEIKDGKITYYKNSIKTDSQKTAKNKVRKGNIKR